MNRGKKQMTAQQIKQKNKEVRSSVQTSAPEEVSNESTTWKILSKFPKKIAEKDLSYVKSAEKGMKAKKAKLHTKHKRTTPGQVEKDIPSYPHIHSENKKVIKRVEKQSVSQGRRLSRKLSRTK